VVSAEVLAVARLTFEIVLSKTTESADWECSRGDRRCEFVVWQFAAQWVV